MEGGATAKMENELNGNAGLRRRSFWSRHRWLKWTAFALLAVFVVLATAVTIALHRAEPVLHAYIIQALEEHFHSRVELDEFHVSVASGLWAEGKGLRIWPPAEIHGVTVPAQAPDRP